MFARNDKLIKEIGLRLQKVRKQARLSSKDMAAHMGITRGAYVKNERGMNFPGLETLRRLSRDLDISMDWLFFNKEPIHYKEKSNREKELEQAVTAMKSELDEMNIQADKAKNESDQLKNQLDEAKNELHEERKKQEKAVEDRERSFEMRPEVRELLDYMEQDGVFYHRLMLNFQEFRQQKKEIGDIDMADTSTAQLLDQS